MSTASDMLKDKVAVVVGGSGGIGREVCRLLAGAGARVVVGYRSGREAAETLAGRLAVREGAAPHLHLPNRSRTVPRSRRSARRRSPPAAAWTSWSTPPA